MVSMPSYKEILDLQCPGEKGIPLGRFVDSVRAVV